MLHTITPTAACRHDSVSRSLLEQATLYIVPSMNPDGAWRGHLRTNACGMNLNRAWANPSLAESPEVYHVLHKMRETGVDMLVDVHGDEAIPHNFIAYSEGIPDYTDKMEACKQKFGQFLRVANPDFQTVRLVLERCLLDHVRAVAMCLEHVHSARFCQGLHQAPEVDCVLQEVGYEQDAPGEANMAVASNAVAQEFDCFAFTLEQPFKDCANFPDPEYGWNPGRCRKFGSSFVTAIRQIIPDL